MLDKSCDNSNLQSILLPPPPPPLPPLQSLPSKNSRPQTETESVPPEYDDELKSLISVEVANQLSTTNTVFQYFRPLLPQSQEGPTCGLVALSMALRNAAISVSADKLKEMAVSSQWSNHGEMFSCEWMSMLGTKVGAKCSYLKGGLFSNLQHIIDCILDGGSVLIPYDKDKNNAPGLFKGTQAHWAVLAGLVLLEVNLEDFSQVANVENSSFRILNHPKDRTSVSVIGNRLHVNIDDAQSRHATLYVCAFQGLSRHVHLWPFHQLAESNHNLTTVDPKRQESAKVPADGVKGGLCGQCVLLSC